MDSTPTSHEVDEIAIVGMAGRFPGADNIDQFWRNLRDGVESVTFFTDEELIASGVDPSMLSNPNYVKAGSILEGIDLFDAAFFGLSPREAETIEPQHRLFLEYAWEALENSGYDPERYEGQVGVYAGVGPNAYLLNLYLNPPAMESMSHFQIMIGNEKDHLPTRVSYKLNLRGPSVTIQTSCSTSLVTVHFACQSLLDNQCDMAVAGGVALSSLRRRGYLYQEGGINSPDGHCRAFDAKAQGTIGGSGVGVVVLKRLEDALADGDLIHAVIKGSAINNDGSLKVGYAAPSVEGQIAVIADALAMAGVDAATIGYVEAHGTGTALGDPIEIAALNQVFQTSAATKNSCAIGSVKTNIGHLDAAAGVAGLIKTVLALKHKMLPPSLHFETPNPNIDFRASPFYVNTKLKPWEAGRTPRRAGVSSFGIGGTNAHVILEEAPVVEPSQSGRPWQLLALSAKTSTALETATSNLASYLSRHPDINLADASYVLQTGRKGFAHRRAIVCRDVDTGVAALRTLNPKRVFTSDEDAAERPVFFMFSGQGSQYVNMGLELYQTEPKFRARIDQCSEMLRPDLGLDLRDVLYPNAQKMEEAVAQLEQTLIAQPALFTIGYAMAKTWEHLGVRPRAMIGHSVGEYVAACVAGNFSLEDGLRLVAMRAQLMQRLPKGSMLAVTLGEQEVQSLLNGEISLAAVNGPDLCVLSGLERAIDEVEKQLGEKGVQCRRLQTSHAFHSHMMDGILTAFAEEVKKTRLNVPEIEYISNLTGEWKTAAEAADAGYWVKHLRSTVRFGDGLRAVMKEANGVLLDIGPGQTLSTLAKRSPDKRPDHLVVSSFGHPRKEESDAAHLQQTLGQLWVKKVKLDWSGLYTNEKRQRIELPTYPFERERYWIEALNQPESIAAPQSSLKKKPDVSDWFYVPLWKQSISPLILESHNIADQASDWLIFGEEDGLGSRLAERLRQQAQHVILVVPGEQYARVNKNAYQINPGRRDDYDLLLEDLRASGRSPARLVHLWSITADDSQQPLIESLESSLSLGFYSLLFLTQAIGEQNLNGSHQIWAVSNNMQAVTGEEALCPLKATLLGLTKVIPREYPHLTCRSIDFGTAKSEMQRDAKILDQLLSELATAPDEAVVAYRGNYRWVQSFDTIRLEDKGSRPARLREGGVYLITGGLDGIGFEIAQYLARAVRARLVLVGRSVLPERSEWSEWLESHTAQDTVSLKLKRALSLEELGSEVLTASADVSDLAQMRDVIKRAYQRFDEIHGVIHSAGIPPKGLIQLKTAEEAAAVLAPKLNGTLVLDELLKETKLDFFVICSSLSSIMGAYGHVDYSAANAFLDSFAHYKTSRSPTLTVSINWGAWQQTGMAAKSSLNNSINQRVIERGMLPQEGVNAFSRVLRARLPQIIVSPQDLHALIALIAQSKASQASSDSGEPGRAQPIARSHKRPQLQNTYVGPRNEAEQFIAGIWRDLLGIDLIGIHDNFFEVGGDSILGLQVAARANQSGLRLTPKQLFQYQTIAELAAVAGEPASIHSQQGVVIGSAPLTPIQYWFFEQETAEPHYWYPAIVLEARERLEVSLLEETIRRLLIHHDALRLRFNRTQSGWQQTIAAPDETFRVLCVDLSPLSVSERELAIDRVGTELRASLNLTDGPLLRCALFNFGAHDRDKLLLVIHPLAVDAKSWRILQQDFQTVYQQLRGGKAVRLPAKTTSFRQWARRLTEHAQSAALKDEPAYWLAEPRELVASLPVDLPMGDNGRGSSHGISLSLSEEESLTLLQELPSAYHARIGDILLTALAHTLARWTGKHSLLIDLESDGRDYIIEGMGLSRTVGRFTALFPLFLEIQEINKPEILLRLVKEQLRQVPNNGFGYGLLRYLRGEQEIVDRLGSLPQAEVSFVYRENSDSTPRESSTLAQWFVPSQAPLGRRRHLLEVSVAVTNRQLQATWTYSANLYRAETIGRLAANFVEILRAFIGRSHSPEAASFTPSDFPIAALSQKDLDDLLAEFGDSE